MEGFKHKFLGLFHKNQPDKIPIIGFSSLDYCCGTANIDGATIETCINSKTLEDLKRPDDQAILNSVEVVYFQQDLDACRFELQKLTTPQIDLNQVRCDFQTLKRQHEVVQKKCLQIIVENQRECNEHIRSVRHLLDIVQMTLLTCQNSRTVLHCNISSVEKVVGILRNTRRRHLVHTLLEHLQIIRDLNTFDGRVRNLIRSEDFIGAIEDLQRCQQLALRYTQFVSVNSVIGKLQETIDCIDEQFDTALSQMCYEFNRGRYENICRAYGLLQKSPVILIDNLHVHYITAIYNSSVNTVQSYSLDDNVTSPTAAVPVLSSMDNKNPYTVICQNVDPVKFIMCLRHLCQILFRVINSYKQLTLWYPDGDFRRKLERNHQKIWDDVQRKVSTLLQNGPMDCCVKFDNLLTVLRIVNRLIKVGEEFACSASVDLQATIRRQILNYFETYHRNRLEELRIFMENEIWHLCPVRCTFTILQLQEFRTIRLSPICSNRIRDDSSQQQQQQQQDDLSTTTSSSGAYLQRFTTDGTPFDNLSTTSLDDDADDDSVLLTDDSDNDISDDLSDDDDDDEKPKNPCFITNSSLLIMRLCGKYLQMARLLHQISPEILSYLNELYLFYMRTIHTFFTSDLVVTSDKLYSDVLNDVLTDDGALPQPHLSDQVHLTVPEQLFGLYERIVAVESVIFLTEQFQLLQPLVGGGEMAPPFHSTDVALHLRRPVYMAALNHIFDFDQILCEMSKVQWDCKDLVSEHSPYIDLILRQIQIFVLRFNTNIVSAKFANTLMVPIQDALWVNIAHLLTHTLVQGFAQVKKCSNAGRALMQLDFTQFRHKFEVISSLKHPFQPYAMYVENYIKAYYLPEDELEVWLGQHRDQYAGRHLVALVQCACSNRKKIRSRLLQLLET